MLFGKKKRRICRLLIVEDEPLVAFDTEHFLRDEEFEIVATVDRVADAMEAIRRSGDGGIDGAAGIARRIAHLTAGQTWPDAASPGIAVFTRSEDRPPPPLAALAPYGIGTIETI